MLRLGETLGAYQRRDPAARSKAEVFLLYAGVHATIYHRLAHWLYCRRCRFLARAVSQWSRFWTGIEIHPGARIGRRFVVDHGTGKDVGKRHPTIGSNVMIGAGAKVLGPITIHDNSRIAAGAVVLQEVPEGATAVGVPAQIVRLNGEKVRRYADEVDQTSVENPTLVKIAALTARVEELERQIGDRS